jgi:hypothetical protein
MVDVRHLDIDLPARENEGSRTDETQGEPQFTVVGSLAARTFYRRRVVYLGMLRNAGALAVFSTLENRRVLFHQRLASLEAPELQSRIPQRESLSSLPSERPTRKASPTVPGQVRVLLLESRMLLLRRTGLRAGRSPRRVAAFPAGSSHVYFHWSRSGCFTRLPPATAARDP